MPILHYMYYAKYGSGLLRVSTSYAYQGVNRKQVLHPRIPRSPLHTVFLQVPHAQTVTADSVGSMGCMVYRSRDRGEGSSWQVTYHSRCNTVACLTDSGACGGEAGPETYRFRCKTGQKGSVMHRFRGCRGKLDAKEIQVPPRFPRLRGCTRPIVNSWVKFFPWGTGEGVPFWACQAKSTCGHSTGGIYFWSVSASSGLCPIPAMSSKIDTRPFHVRRGKHAAIPRGTYRPRRRAYPSGGQL